ncbi:MAG: hypothetical protein EZS28_044187, partial [Streblomastix strix]
MLPYTNEELKNVADQEVEMLKLAKSKHVPENIFIDEHGNVKTGDFGLAKKLDNYDYAKAEGTKVYEPIEAFVFQQMTAMSDIWSLGVIVTELLTGRHPYEGQTQLETIDNIKNNRKTPLPDEVQGQMRDIIERMLNSDQNKRPTAQQILDNELMQNQIDIEDPIEYKSIFKRIGSFLRGGLFKKTITWIIIILVVYFVALFVLQILQKVVFRVQKAEKEKQIAEEEQLKL